MSPQEFDRLKRELPPETLAEYRRRESAAGSLKLLAIVFPPLTVLLCGQVWAALLNLFLLWPLGIVPGIVHAFWIVDRHTMSFQFSDELTDGIRRAKSIAPHGVSTKARVPSAVQREIENYLSQGRKIQAIKRVRDTTGWGLRDSKRYVEAVAEHRHPEVELSQGTRGVDVAAGEERGIPSHVRQAVLDRDDYICRYCGRRSQTVEVDHVVPVSQCGASTLSNLVTACRNCNRRKGGRTPKQAGMSVLPVRTSTERR